MLWLTVKIILILPFTCHRQQSHCFLSMRNQRKEQISVIAMCLRSTRIVLVQRYVIPCRTFLLAFYVTPDETRTSTVKYATMCTAKSSPFLITYTFVQRYTTCTAETELCAICVLISQWRSPVDAHQRRGYSVIRLPGEWVRLPLGTWMSVTWDCFVLTSGSLDVGLITVQRSPTKYGMSEYDREAWQGGPDPLMADASLKEKSQTRIINPLLLY